VEVILGGGAAGLSAAMLRAPARRLWRDVYRPWWDEAVAGRLPKLGWERFAPLHRAPLAAGAALALAGAIGAGGAGALAGVAGAAALTRALPALLDRIIEGQVETADAQLARLAQELAQGIARGEQVAALTRRLERALGGEAGPRDRRFSPLLRDLFRRAAVAAEIAPALHRTCDVFEDALLPTARLIGMAWRQAGLGVNVPAAVRAISKNASEHHAFQAEIRGRIDPLRRQFVAMLIFPILMAAGTGFDDPQMMITAPACWFLLGGLALIVVAWAYLNHFLQRLQ